MSILKKQLNNVIIGLPYMINHPIRLPNDALSDPRNMALMKNHFPFMKSRAN